MDDRQLSIGETIQKERKAKGLTQSDLAKAIGSHVNVIFQYENNKRIPTLTNGTKIANVLQLDLNYLMGLTQFNNLDKININKLIIDVKTVMNDSSIQQDVKDEFYQRLSLEYWKAKKKQGEVKL